MKKTAAILAIVVTALVGSAAPVAAASAGTGTVGPAEEPTWVIPLVAAFILLGIVAAILSARRDTR